MLLVLPFRGASGGRVRHARPQQRCRRGGRSRSGAGGGGMPRLGRFENAPDFFDVASCQPQHP